MKRKTALICIMAMIFIVASACSNNNNAGSSTSPPESTNANASETANTTEATNTTEAEAESQEPAETPVYEDLGGVTVKFANWGDSSWSKPGDDEKGLREQAFREELMKNYNFKIEYLAIPDDSYLPTVTSSIMSGNPAADVFNLMMDAIPGFAAKGLLYPLDTVKSYDFINDPSIQTAVRDAVTWNDGHTYAYYRGSSAYLGSKTFTVFNKKIASSLGLDPYDLWTKGEWTWDKFQEYAALATKDTNNDGVNDQWGLTGDMVLLPLGYVGSTGAELLDKDHKIHYNDPKVTQALEAFKNLKPYLQAAPEGSNWDFYMTAFAKGNVLFSQANQWWMTSRYQDMQDDWGIVPFPLPKAGDPYYTVSDIEGVQAIPYNTKNPEAVATVIKLLAQPRPWDLDENGQPLVDKSDPNWFWPDYENQVRDEQSLESLSTIINNEKFYFDKQRMYNVYWSDPGFQAMGQAVWDGTMTPAQAIQANEKPTQEKLNAFLAEANSAAAAK
ncbi:ABC transporter substrate-binding protein [Paenibacillus sp. BC26]|uniref:ABC transporter substrate-binding protein n=1 Tax=Paenibacillus sp. BC26 TaxID=1881032 RepID=UPI0008EF8469|nr:extracellular solute-binding protein [Paenibacillus sp. BC26]SFS73938.1 ABC-type glycerol-3-phosphate transport system, substrate-binding protein [Paenibacillus sp. BC26]